MLFCNQQEMPFLKQKSAEKEMRVYMIDKPCPIFVNTLVQNVGCFLDVSHIREKYVGCNFWENLQTVSFEINLNNYF